MEENILNKIKKGIRNTNCFFSLDQIQAKIQNSDLQVLQDDFFLGLLEKTEYDFGYLYFYIESDKEFKLNTLVDKGELVVDVIFLERKRQKWSHIFTAFEEVGFKHYTSFNRMVMLNIDRRNSKDYQNDLVLQAKEKDFEEIKLILEQNFDVYSERIPTIVELKKAINFTYCIKEKDKIVALLISDKNGVSEELRYWLVDENYRGKKYGSILMNYFLNKNKETVRYLLWVQQDNTDTIEKYEYFGFRKDNLINNIYVK